MTKHKTILLMALATIGVLIAIGAAWLTIDDLRVHAQETAPVDASDGVRFTLRAATMGPNAPGTDQVAAATQVGGVIAYAAPTLIEQFPAIVKAIAALREAPASRTRYFQNLVNLQGYTVYQWNVCIDTVSPTAGGSARVQVSVTPRVRGRDVRPVFVPAKFLETWTWDGKNLAFVTGTPAAGSSFAIFTD